MFLLFIVERAYGVYSRRSQWSHQQAKLFNHTVKLLTNERIARLANEGVSVSSIYAQT